MKLLPILLLALALTAGLAQAQPFHTNVLIDSTSNTAPNLVTTGSGGVVFGGATNGGSLPATGATGTRFMWYPGKAALRAGEITTWTGHTAGRWDDVNIGYWSVGLGGNPVASGEGAVALGSSEASGANSFAAGWGSTSAGVFSAAVAIGTASGTYSFATSYGFAYGYQSFAFGGMATGDYAAAIGTTLEARAVNSTVVGQYNDPIGDIHTPAATDPIFVVGTGTANTLRKNGFEVRRDGTIKMGKAQGDISMGEFAP